MIDHHLTIGEIVEAFLVKVGLYQVVGFGECHSHAVEPYLDGLLADGCVRLDRFHFIFFGVLTFVFLVFVQQQIGQNAEAGDDECTESDEHPFQRIALFLYGRGHGGISRRSGLLRLIGALGLRLISAPWLWFRFRLIGLLRLRLRLSVDSGTVESCPLSADGAPSGVGIDVLTAYGALPHGCTCRHSRLRVLVLMCVLGCLRGISSSESSRLKAYGARGEMSVDEFSAYRARSFASGRLLCSGCL